MTDQVELKDFVQEVRSQLQSAMMEWHESEPAFTVNEIELEMQVAVGKTTDGKIGVALIADFGASKSTSLTRTHVVRLKISPEVKRKGGQRPIIKSTEPNAI